MLAPLSFATILAYDMITQPALFIIFFLITLFCLGGVLVLRAAQKRQEAKRVQAQLDSIVSANTKLQERLDAMSDFFRRNEKGLTDTLDKKFSYISQNLNFNLKQQSEQTYKNLKALQERMAVIDSAQNNLQKAANKIVEFQHILTNKQTRGAFGQSQMEAIIRDALPANSYKFQSSLTNGKRPDCLILLPNEAPALVIDAKFPLEAWTRLQDAHNKEYELEAAQNFRRDMRIHIRAISEKYLIAGETFETVFLFVPSESIFATIYEKFDELIQEAHRQHVQIVSPTSLMLSVTVVQSILKDAYLRHQAHHIQHEVMKLLDDVKRLCDRTEKLKKNYEKEGENITEILTSAKKINNRGQGIIRLDLVAVKKEAEAIIPSLSFSKNSHEV